MNFNRILKYVKHFITDSTIILSMINTEKQQNRNEYSHNTIQLKQQIIYHCQYNDLMAYTRFKQIKVLRILIL